MWEKQWRGGSKTDEEVNTILLTTPEYHNFLPAVFTLIEVGGVQWMDTATCERFLPAHTLTWHAHTRHTHTHAHTHTR